MLSPGGNGGDGGGGGPNFWDVNRYRIAVKRIDDGYKRCSDLTSFLQDRAECEKTFARQLRVCSRRWAEILQPDRGVEYGSTLSAWTAFLVETNRTADLHSRIADRLREVVEHVRAWQKNNYQRGVMSNRTVKEYDDEFRKAQKPWAKAHGRMSKARKDYQCSWRALASARSQKGDGAEGVAEDGSLEQKKAEERVKRCLKETEATETKYRSSLEELERIMPAYVEQMGMVFEKTQAFERERLRFFKEVFKGLHDSLDVSKSSELSAIYDELAVCIDGADAVADTDWWARSFGAKMPLHKPRFVDAAAAVVVVAAAAAAEAEAPPAVVNQNRAAPPPPAKHLSNSALYYPDANNPFSPPAAEAAAAGVPVRALYDYSAQEADELSLTEGMEFLMIDDVDEQGWSKGRSGSKEGLYPAAYAKPV